MRLRKSVRSRCRVIVIGPAPSLAMLFEACSNQSHVDPCSLLGRLFASFQPL
jgi:hypothetical protein